MTLEERIEKKEDEIKRIEAKLEKYLVKYGDDKMRDLIANDKLDELRSYLESLGHEWYTEPFKVYYAAKELKEARLILEKHRNMLKIKNDKAAVVKIPVIWEFLMKYKAMMSKWFHENAALYYELRANESEEWNKYKGSEQYLSRVSMWRSQYRAELEWRKNYYEPIHAITKDLYKYPGKLDEVRLEQILSRDVENRYFKLVDQVTKIVGAIIDATELHITNGELNGYIRGEKGNCVVTTIGAGGYNIQCFHYRTLVKEVKKI